MRNDIVNIKDFNASVYSAAKRDANLFSLKTMGALALLAIISILLNLIGVFKVDLTVMLVVMLTSFAVFSLPTIIYLICDKIKKIQPPAIESEWFRVVIMVSIYLGIGLTCVSLSFHATILMAIPPVMAAQYHYKKRTFIVVLIVTMLLVPISIYGSFFFGVPDRNFIKGQIPEDEMMLLSKRFEIATPTRMLEIFTHYTIPILFGIIVIVFLVKGISQRNRNMLRKQRDLSEKIREEMEQNNNIDRKRHV